ncbi:MAG: AraC family transcriptional regulator [Paenibacillus sp.]|nr:AraC family transcriptional regulator [Paenibacillus sp.]
MTVNEPLSAQVIYAHYPKYVKPYAGGKFVHRHYLIRLQTEGHCRATINDEPYSFQPRDLLLLEPGDVSQFLFEPDPVTGKVGSGNYTIMCRGSWMESWWAAETRPKKAAILTSDSMMALFKELVLERRRVGERWKEASGYLLQALCIHIDRTLTTMQSEPTKPSFVVMRMKQYIDDEEHRSSPVLRVKDVARHVGLSESRASHLFKEAFGQGMIAYFLDTRLRIARDRIKYMNSTLEHIADITGFGSYSYFHRAFRHKYGISPKEYRDSLSLLPEQ